MFCSSGLSSPPNGRPYSIPTRRSAAAERPSDPLRDRAAGEAARAALDLAGGAPPTRWAIVALPTSTASTPARSSATTSSRVAAWRSAIASLPAGTSGSRSRIRSRSSSSSSASRGESRKISGLDPLERRGERLLVVDVDDDLEPELGRAGVQLLEVLLVVVLLDDDQAGVRAGLARGLRRRVDAEEDRERGRVADAVDGADHARGPPRRPPRPRARPSASRDEREDRDAVPFGDRLAEASRPGHWRGSYCGRRRRHVPIGCQTVFSSRKAAISHGLCAVGGAVDDALDVLGGEPLELGREAVGAGDVDRVHVHVRRRATARAPRAGR